MPRWVSLLIAIVVLCVVAYLANAFLPGPIGTVASVLCGLGVLICIILILVDLIRGGHGHTRA